MKTAEIEFDAQYWTPWDRSSGVLRHRNMEMTKSTKQQAASALNEWEK